MQEGSGSLETSPQDSSECPVCYEILEEPKQLSCGHSLCAHCTLVLAKHDNQKTKIECPQCRTNTVVPETGLPTNFALKGLVQTLKNTLKAAQLNSKYDRCAVCLIKCAPHQMLICTTCTTEGLQSKPKESLCGFCAFKNHKSHNLIEAADFASEKYHQKVTDEIKKLVSTTTPGVKLLAEGFKKIEFDLGQAFEEFYDIPDQLSKLSNANSQFKIYSKADLANNLDVMRSTKELTTKACRDLERIQKLLKENIMDFSLIARIYSLDLAEKLKALMKSEKAAINPDKNVNNSHRDREAAGPSNLTVKEKIPSKGSIWKLNEIIMCKCTKTASFYKAKIVDVFQYDDDIAYQVHYLGWSNRHDERIAGSQTNILFRKYIEEADYISFTNRHKKKRKADEVALEITHKRFNRIESVTPPRSPKRKDSSAKKAPVYLIDDDSD